MSMVKRAMENFVEANVPVGVAQRLWKMVTHSESSISYVGLLEAQAVVRGKSNVGR